MKNILSGLDPRQRLMVVIGALLLAILVVALTWGSFLKDVNRLETVVMEKRKLEHWMQQASKEALKLRGVAVAGGAAAGDKSLLALVDETAKQGGLGQAMKRVEPEGQDKVRIQLDDALFDDISRWLDKLDTSHSVRVERITIDKLERAGFVNVRLTLAAGASE